MHALIMTDFGKPVTVAQIPTPRSTSPHEVLIRVHAASLTRFDLDVASGLLQGHLEHFFPVTVGRDFAGVIDRVGAKVDRFAVGDAVIGMIPGLTVHDGSIAEYVVVDAVEHLSHLPRNLDFVQAAALPVAARAALSAVDAVDPRSGDLVLVVGATGGVGSYAVQLAAARGSHVIATGRPDDAEQLGALGAAEMVDYRGDLHAVLRERYPDGVQVLIDAVTTDPAAFTALAAHLTDGGRVASTNMAANITTLAESGIKATNVMADLASHDVLDRIVAMIEDGALRLPELRVFDLFEAPAALEAMRHDHTRGKFVIRIKTP